MTATPSILLNAYNISYNGDGEDDDAGTENVLMELLYSLSHLQDCTPRYPCEEEHLSTLNWVCFFLYGDEKDILEGCTEGDKLITSSEHVQEWVAGLTLLRKIINSAHYYQERNHQGDTVGIPPHILLRYTIDSAMEYQRSHQSDGNTSMSIHKILYLLLTTIALRSLIESETTKQRWRRVQSMCLESIALFQSLVIDGLAGLVHMTDNSHTDDHFHAKYFITATTIFCKYLSPALQPLVVMMENMEENKVSNMSKSRPRGCITKCISAGMIQTASTLTYAIMEYGNLENEFTNDDIYPSWGNSLIVDLTNTIFESKISLFRYEFILTHPLRLYYEERKRTLEVDFCDDDGDDDDHDGGYCHMKHVEDCILREFSPLLCKDLNELTDNTLEFSALCGMKMMWNANGVAIMAHAILDQRHTCNSFPEVFSTAMLFAMFFPHVMTLLFLSQRDEDEKNTECSGIENDKTMHSTSIRYFEMGMKLLYVLLDRLHPLGMEHNVILNRKNDKQIFKIGPLAPSGVLQLLLNTLVNVSFSTNNSITSTSNTSRSLHAKSSKWMSREKILHSIRRLLSIYQNDVQLSIISGLIQTSPFSFLLPFLLDLTRHLMTSGSATEEAIPVVKPFVLDMITCLATGDDHDEKFIGDEFRLLQNVEVYCSVVGLIRLLVLAASRDSNNTELESILDQLDSFYFGLQSTLQKWENKKDNNEHVPEDCFRLFLLDNALNDLRAVRGR